MGIGHITESKELKNYGRITLYARQKERKALLDKVIRYTGANSLSDAIFTVLSEYVREKEKSRGDVLEVLERTKGIWAGDEKIEKALEEIEKQWQAWDQEY